MFPTLGATSSHLNITQEPHQFPPPLRSTLAALLGFPLPISQSVVVGQGGAPRPCRGQAPLVLSLGCISESQKAVNELCGVGGRAWNQRKDGETSQKD